MIYYRYLFDNIFFIGHKNAQVGSGCGLIHNYLVSCIQIRNSRLRLQIRIRKKYLWSRILKKYIRVRNTAAYPRAWIRRVAGTITPAAGAAASTPSHLTRSRLSPPTWTRALGRL